MHNKIKYAVLIILALVVLGTMLFIVACAPAQPTPAPQPGLVPTVTAAPVQPTNAPSASNTAQGPCTTEAADNPMPTEKIRLVIGTGGTGGVYFPYGGGLARILTEKMANTAATAEVTGGSVDNIKLIGVSNAVMGMSTVDSAYDAIRGVGSYKDTGEMPACTLAVLYSSFLHVVAADESGIKTVADMKGKRISMGSAGSSTEDAAERIIEAAGLDPQKDITRDALSVAESVAAMKDGKIDAFFWIGGLPTAAVKDLTSTPNTKIRFIDVGQYVPQLVAKYGPVYTNSTLPKTVYAGVEADVPGIGIGNILFVNADMPEPLAYEILKTLFDNVDAVHQVHPEAKKFSIATAAKGSSIPFHPGAIRYFTEKGVWKP